MNCHTLRTILMGDGRTTLMGDHLLTEPLMGDGLLTEPY
jgi:hypothetical protein